MRCLTQRVIPPRPFVVQWGPTQPTSPCDHWEVNDTMRAALPTQTPPNSAPASRPK